MTKSKRIDAPIKTPLNGDKNSTGIGDKSKPEDLKKPKILFEDRGGFERCINSYNKVINEINRFASMFEKTMKRPFDKQAFNQIIEGNPEFQNEFHGLIENELKKHEDFFHESIQQGYQSRFDNLMEAFNSVRQAFEYHYCDGLYWQEIRIEKNRAVFTKSDEQRVWQRYFIMKTDNPIFEELSNLTEAHIKASRELNEFIKKNKLELGIYGDVSWQWFVALQGYGGFLTYDDQGNLNVNWKKLFKRNTIHDFENQKEDEPVNA